MSNFNSNRSGSKFMKIKGNSRVARIIFFGGFTIVMILLIAVLLNLDLFLRLDRAVRNGKLTRAALQYEIAAYDIRQPFPVTPERSKVSSRDGMTEIHIPAGEFIMGSGEDQRSDNIQHRIYLDAYWMDQMEVTNAMYAKCLRAAGCTHPALYNTYFDIWAYRDYPVVYVNWYQADQYCRWAGRGLPTEAQWEKAARGADGRRYPWGNQLPNPRLVNFNLSLIGEPVPVYRYPLGASPYGVLNMSGNVREWIADWYGEFYYQSSPHTDPTGPATGTERSLRSGSYAEDQQQISTYTRFKHEPGSAGLSRGFRCAGAP
jgi:formylglycine-generating enzyme required for sulfatase activity